MLLGVPRTTFTTLVLYIRVVHDLGHNRSQFQHSVTHNPTENLDTKPVVA